MTDAAMSNSLPQPRHGGPSSGSSEARPAGAAAPDPSATFVVKLRSTLSRSWGNESEVVATSAQHAAELVAEQRLSPGPGRREDLRARVWKLPYGTVPEIHFYVVAPDEAAAPAP